jgi:hypothetical protein
MPNGHNFEHLPLLRTYQGRAKLRGGGSTAPQTRANAAARAQHQTTLTTAATTVTAQWQQRKAERVQEHLPVIPEGVPLLLQVDPGLDLDVLRERFAFEIVAEQEEGYVIVASEDIALRPFVDMVNAFAGAVRGSAAVAQVHRLFEDPEQTERLRRILSERLSAEWPALNDAQDYLVDIGVACVGTREILRRPTRG